MIADDDAYQNGQAMAVIVGGKTRLTIRLDTYTDKEVRYKLSFAPDSTVAEKPVQGWFGEVFAKDDAFTLYQESSIKTDYRFAFAIVSKDQPENQPRVDVYCQKEFTENSRLEKSDKGAYYVRTLDQAARQQLREYGYHKPVVFGECVIRVFEGDCVYHFQAALPWPDLSG